MPLDSQLGGQQLWYACDACSWQPS